MAKQENYTFQSADEQKTTIHAVKWLPESGEVKGVIQLVHGMIEYIERYSQFAEYLTERGFVVMGHDHIGHGDSVSSPDDWGIMHAAHPDQVMIEDMFTNYQIIKKQYPDVPYFILGHSMGSYMLREFLCEKADQFTGVNGAIIMGTGTVSPGTCNGGLFVLNLLKAFRGRDYKSASVANMMYDAPYKGYSLDGSDPENSWLSKNVESVKKYYTDPKDTFLFSVNGYYGMVTAVKYDGNVKNIRKMNHDIPILFVSGADDPVGARSVGTQQAYEKFKEAGIKDVTIKLFDGDRHEILQETDRLEVVFPYIYDWMSSKM